MQDGKCPKCRSEYVVPNVRVIDPGDIHKKPLTAIVQEKPHAWLSKGEVESELEAWVCGVCGYTEFYASNPTALLAAHAKAYNAETK